MRVQHAPKFPFNFLWLPLTKPQIIQQCIQLFFYQSLNRNCKGVYENVDPRNTKCLELVAEYHKVNTLNFNHFLLGTNYTNINSNF